MTDQKTNPPSCEYATTSASWWRKRYEATQPYPAPVPPDDDPAWVLQGSNVAPLLGQVPSGWGDGSPPRYGGVLDGAVFFWFWRKLRGGGS